VPPIEITPTPGRVAVNLRRVGWRDYIVPGGPTLWKLPGTDLVCTWEEAFEIIAYGWADQRALSLIQPFYRDREFWLAFIGTGGPLGAILAWISAGANLLGSPWDQLLAGGCVVVASMSGLIFQAAKSQDKIKIALRQAPPKELGPADDITPPDGTPFVKNG